MINKPLENINFKYSPTLSQKADILLRIKMSLIPTPSQVLVDWLTFFERVEWEHNADGEN